MPTPQFFINGEASQSLVATDRSIHYGDGLFETIAVVDKAPQHLTRHLARLQLGCERLGIHFNSLELLQKEVLTRCQTTTDNAILKIIITRGSGGRGYAASNLTANRILALYPWPNYPKDYAINGVDVCFCKTTVSRNPALAGLKHLNRLEQIMARNEWHDHSFQEGIMLDELGNVIEGTLSNVFMIKNKQLMTPDLSYSGVNGIMRGIILEQNPGCKITNISKDDLIAADQLFLTNSVIGVWPVKSLNGVAYDIKTFSTNSA